MATCTDDLIKEVGQLIQLGVPPMVAAAVKGVHEDEFTEWMRRGEINGRGEHRYAKFHETVMKGESTAEAALLGHVRTAATKGSWQAATWLLERLWPERYVRKSVSDEVKGQPGTPGQPDPFAGVDKVVPIRKKAGGG